MSSTRNLKLRAGYAAIRPWIWKRFASRRWPRNLTAATRSRETWRQTSERISSIARSRLADRALLIDSDWLVVAIRELPLRSAEQYASAWSSGYTVSCAWLMNEIAFERNVNRPLRICT